MLCWCICEWREEVASSWQWQAMAPCVTYCSPVPFVATVFLPSFFTMCIARPPGCLLASAESFLAYRPAAVPILLTGSSCVLHSWWESYVPRQQQRWGFLKAWWWRPGVATTP